MTWQTVNESVLTGFPTSFVEEGLGKLEHVSPLRNPLTVRGVNLYDGYSRDVTVSCQMYFNHYTNRPVELAVQLVNTCQAGDDQMAKADDLNRLLEGYRDLWEGVAQPPKASELEAIHRLRDSLRTVMLSPNDATASDHVNAILSDYGAVPRVSLHNGEPHLHFEPVNATMTSWLGTTTAMGLAAVIVENGVDRFGTCNASDCDDVYVDTSRNRSRLHCTTTCSTREAVAAHRKRKNKVNRK